MRINSFGLSRSRDSKGEVVDRPVNDYVNCIHTLVGSGQANAYWGKTDGICSCITSACGMGGGQTPMIIKLIED